MLFIALLVCAAVVNASIPPCRNLARGRPAHQIDTYFHFNKAWNWYAQAKWVGDGNRCPIYKERTCSHTIKGNKNPWLAIDLGSAQTVDKVLIITSPNPKADNRVTNLYIAVSNQPPSVLSRPPGKQNKPYGKAMNVAGMARCNQFKGNPKPGRANVLQCHKPLRGRYVYLAVPGTGYLSLCEVEVYSPCHGLPSPAPKYCKGKKDPDAGLVIGTAVHPCDAKNPKNGGCAQLCIKKGNNAVCACKPGYKSARAGRSCIKTYPCAIKNGGCGQGCKNVGGCPSGSKCHAVCTCKKGYKLKADKKHCVKAGLPGNACRKMKKKCAHQCRLIGKGKAQCRCRKGFTLHKNKRSCMKNKKKRACQIKNGGCGQKCHNRKGNKRVCSCKKGYRLQKNKRSCKKRSPCEGRGGKGPCQHYCKAVGGKARCSCKKGYTLRSGKINCKPIKNPCKTKGKGGCAQICKAGKGLAFSCQCDKPAVLDDDGKTCIRKKHPCDGPLVNGGCAQICKRVGDKAVCLCKKGWRSERAGRSCIPVSPCDKNKGGCAHRCSNVNGVAKCSCQRGYRLMKNGKGCEKPAPCERNKGGCAHICSNVKGRAVCSCRPGFVMRGRKCNPIHPCDLPSNGKCQQICTKKGFAAVCACKKGFKLSKDGHTCSIDPPKPVPGPCETDNGGCEQVCNPMGKAKACSCKPGFKLEDDSRHCAPIHPCDLPSEGGCSHTCVKKEGMGFVCTCPDGFELQDVDLPGGVPTQCEEVHPCEVDNGGCEQECVKDGDDAVCACGEGYSLADDDKSCTKDEPRCPQVEECGNAGAKWTKLANKQTHGAKGYRKAFDDLEVCKARCLSLEVCCNGIDWTFGNDPANGVPYRGVRCWLHMDSVEDLDTGLQRTDMVHQYRPGC